MALASLNKTAAVKAETDSLGGATLLESNIYPFTVKVAYFGESSGGAVSLNLQLETDKGELLHSTIYLTSAKAKGQKNTYTGQDGKEHYLPGFSLGTSLAELVLDKDIGTLDTEEKVIKLYNYTEKRDIDTKVAMIMDLLGKQVIGGVLKCEENKNVKDATGTYVPDPTGATREFNEVSKFFDMDGYTIAEKAASAPEPAFVHAWKEKWKGITRKRIKPVTGGSVAGAPKTASVASTTASLFPPK